MAKDRGGWGCRCVKIKPAGGKLHGAAAGFDREFQALCLRSSGWASELGPIQSPSQMMPEIETKSNESFSRGERAHEERSLDTVADNATGSG